MMSRIFRSIVAGVVTAVICSAASAQLVPIPLVTWKYQQPWTKPWHAFDSIVRDCQGNPMQFATGVAPVAADDWICTASGPIVRIQWWGVSPQPAQVPNRQFLIRIFTDVQCRPANLVYQTCVLATNQYVNIDCRQRRVYRFSANLPAPAFVQTAGTHYWLSIAEVDGAAGAMQSPTLNAVDFRWSAHRNLKNCPALQRLPGPVFIQPLLDPCDQLEEDLSFVLYRSAIIIQVPNNPTGLTALPRPVYVAEFRKQGDPDTIEHVECFTPDDDGSASLHPELTPGMYRMTVRGMGRRPVDSFFDVFFDVNAGTGGAADYFIDLGNVAGPMGDVDGDGDTDFADITGVLANWRP
jgi:hypothetical protein